MSSSSERIAPPRRSRDRSTFSRIVTPLFVTAAALACLLLPLLDTGVSRLLFMLTRPLVIALVVIGAGAVTSLVTLIAGVLVGLRVRFFAVGPLQLHVTDTGLTIDVNETWRNFVGSVLLVPRQGSLTRLQATALGGSGVVTSLALATFAVLMALEYGWPGIDDPAIGEISAAFLLALPVGVLIVLVAELLTGGTVLSATLRGTDAQSRRLLATMTIASRMAIGQRPREWEPGLIQDATSVPDTSADHLMGLGFAYLHAVDRGDLTAAGRYLHSFEQWLGESSSSVRPYVLSSLSAYVSLYHERAWFTAAHRRDLDLATEYLNRAAGYDVAYPIEMRVKAEILNLEGDREAATSFARAALDSLDQFPVNEQWRVPFERDLLNRILERG